MPTMLKLKSVARPQQKAVLTSLASPQHAALIQQASAPQVAQLAANVDAITTAASTPGDATSAQAVANAVAADPVAGAIAMRLLATGNAAKWEATTDALNPIAGIARRKPFPVKFLPATVTTASNAGQLTWTPQEEFEGFRLVVPSGQTNVGDAYLSQLQAGDRLMVTQSGRIPFAVLSEKTDCGRIDFPVVRLGETITAQVSATTGAAVEVAAVIMGYARGKTRILPDGAEILYERWEPFDVTVVPQAATATITLQPQRNIIMRRMVLDDTTASFGSVYVTSINVQDDPQFVQNVEIPVQLFSELAQDDWLDFDMCQLGGLITINLRNSNTSVNVTIQGMAVADVVRLPHEVR